jgi:hypothetical protein
VRIQLSTRSGGELLIVGDEHLVVVPTRREAAQYFELDVAARPGHIQTARVQTARRGEVVIIAYADGSLERLQPRTRERNYVAEAIRDGRDPLVGFVLREAPMVAWLSHASGWVRRVEV